MYLYKLEINFLLTRVGSVGKAQTLSPKGLGLSPATSSLPW